MSYCVSFLPYGIYLKREQLMVLSLPLLLSPNRTSTSKALFLSLSSNVCMQIWLLNVHSYFLNLIPLHIVVYGTHTDTYAQVIRENVMCFLNILRFQAGSINNNSKILIKNDKGIDLFA